MRFSSWGVVALVATCSTACTTKTDDYKIQPGGPGGGGSGGGGGDAGIGDGPIAPSDASIMGRVCLATDPRNLAGCAATGASGLTVTLPGATATTAADGKFTIDAPSTSGFVWHVTGTTIVPSVRVLSDFQIPAIEKSVYATMQTDNGPSDVPGQGSIMISVVRNGLGVMGATATATPPGAFSPFYDDAASPTMWTQTATGTAGTIWIPNLLIGSTSVDVIPSAGATAITVPGIPVETGAITFVTIIAP